MQPSSPPSISRTFPETETLSIKQSNNPPFLFLPCSWSKLFLKVTTFRDKLSSAVFMLHLTRERLQSFSKICRGGNFVSGPIQFNSRSFLWSTSPCAMRNSKVSKISHPSRSLQPVRTQTRTPTRQYASGAVPVVGLQRG